MLDAADRSSLALLYHLNSEPAFDPEASTGYGADFKQYPTGGEAVALPPATGGGILDLIRRRRSCRRYAPGSLALGALADLLEAAYGAAGALAAPGGVELETRTVPSAGALYPLELYVVTQRVDTVADGLYHYGIPDRSLVPLEPGLDRDAFAAAFLPAPFFEHANALVFMTAVFDRTLQKYGARGYRYVLLEAGHAAQNLCLAATERGLASLCAGGFVDSAINRFLGLDPVVEAAVYCVGVGSA